MDPDAFDPERFLDAQRDAYPAALAELRRGRKATHWMWYVFPQLRGLGRSRAAAFYGLPDLRAAQDYLAHPVLGPRLIASVEAACAAPAADAQDLLGETDALKFRSCLTLFSEAARRSGGDAAPFERALARFYAGAPDPRTLALLDG